MALNPGLPETFVRCGSALMALGRPDEALASYDRALALRPDFPEAHACRATALHVCGRLDEALAALGECIELCRLTGEHNDEWQALLCRAEVLLAAGETEEATGDAERCLEITGARGDRYGEGVAHLVLAKAGREEHADRAAELLGTPGLRRDNLLDSLIS